MGEGVSSQWAEPRARRTAWFLVGEAPPVGWGQRRGGAARGPRAAAAPGLLEVLGTAGL